MIDIELKKCPFCGSEAAITDGVINVVTMVICKNYKHCGAVVSFDITENRKKYYGENKDTAVAELWNRRRD